MATKPAADIPESENAKMPSRNKKVWLIAILLILALAAGGGWFFLKNRWADEPVAKSEHVAVKGPPTYLPLDNMVINLADPGGERVAQVGIVLELADAATADKIKVYLPTIRGNVLLLISQRTSAELLQIQGKEKLAADILLQVSRPLIEADKNAAKQNLVWGVHFSSFIVQ